MAFDPLALVRPEARGSAPPAPGPPVDELERRLGITEAVRLGANENALGPSPRVLEAIARAGAAAHRYPDSGGFHLKRRLARLMDLTPAHFALGAGSTELIDLLMRLFVGPGDEVVTAHPTFVLYGPAVRLAGGTLIAVPGKAGGIAHDLDAMRAAIGPQTRVVIVCNPNNPTGALVPRDEFERFYTGVPKDVVVVIDEAYHEYVDDPAHPRTLDHLGDDRPLVLLRTFSKVYSLAGLRIGYAIARPEVSALFDRVRAPFNVSSVAQAAALAALDDVAHVEASRALARQGGPALRRDLEALGVTTFPSHTNFVLADFGRDCRPICQALAARGILIRDLVSFGMEPRFARIGIGTETERARLIEALSAVLKGAARGVA
jgi:histidinol-phosphate aminotransferase